MTDVIIPVKASISRRVILEEASRCWDRAKSWASSGNYEYAAKYANHADILLCIVEVDDCGSYGGYDKARGQVPASGPFSDRIEDRLSWLQEITDRSDALVASERQSAGLT